jgi:hypothetical protein
MDVCKSFSYRSCASHIPAVLKHYNKIPLHLNCCSRIRDVRSELQNTGSIELPFEYIMVHLTFSSDTHTSFSIIYLNTRSTLSNFHLLLTTQQPQTMGCGSSKPEGVDNNRPAYPVTNTTPPPPNHAALQSPTAQKPSKGKKRKTATNLGLLSTIVN